MKQNKYDDTAFFQKYSQMDRSRKGLAGAGEWQTLERMLPSFEGKRVLDIGCGFGWHCAYAAEHGAKSVVGVDLSENMLKVAREKNAHERIRYERCAMEEINFGPDSFDVVISSLALHYAPSFDDIVQKVHAILIESGEFVFSAEHPIFTAQGPQDWIYDNDGKALYFPVDRYFEEGKRQANFLNETVEKYHRTMTTYLMALLNGGFHITGFAEPRPTDEQIRTIPAMKDELRRPMMFIVSAVKL